jgi:hypothetical protein
VIIPFLVSEARESVDVCQQTRLEAYGRRAPSDLELFNTECGIVGHHRVKLLARLFRQATQVSYQVFLCDKGRWTYSAMTDDTFQGSDRNTSNFIGYVSAEARAGESGRREGRGGHLEY